MKLLIITLCCFIAFLLLYIKGVKDANRVFDEDYENLLKLIQKPCTESRYYQILGAIKRFRKMKHNEKLTLAEELFRNRYANYGK
jgi:hypothetical protein